MTWVPYPRLVELLGREAARAVIQALGGLAVYIPVRPVPDHPVAVAAGWDALGVLVAHYGGDTIELPRARQAAKERICALLDAGMRPADIARECGVTTRWVRHLARITR